MARSPLPAPANIVFSAALRDWLGEKHGLQARIFDLEETLKRNRAALDLIDPMRPLQYATTMDLMRKDMDAAIAGVQP